ncbi:hypothetical protein ACA910_000260 [Epithemia clementina (nom. ined.)]
MLASLTGVSYPSGLVTNTEKPAIEASSVGMGSCSNDWTVVFVNNHMGTTGHKVPLQVTGALGRLATNYMDIGNVFVLLAVHGRSRRKDGRQESENDEFHFDLFRTSCIRETRNRNYELKNTIIQPDT